VTLTLVQDRPGIITPSRRSGNAGVHRTDTALVRYLEDGRYEIDTNLVENAIRPSCVGKKNWLFIGHPDAGWRSAVIYSLLITDRRYRLDPAAWLTDVLRRIPTCTQANLPELLPWNWKPQAA
jgi:transposase